MYTYVYAFMCVRTFMCVSTYRSNILPADRAIRDHLLFQTAAKLRTFPDLKATAFSLSTSNSKLPAIVNKHKST